MLAPKEEEDRKALAIDDMLIGMIVETEQPEGVVIFCRDVNV